MKINEYQELTRRTSNNNLSYQDSLANAALGLGEAGEVQNIIKKHIFHGHNLDTAKIIDELGDIQFYVAWLADLVGISLEEIMEHNIDKLRKRYPNGFNSEDSINRKA